MKTFHEIENALRDYHWMTREIQRLKDELNTVNTKMSATYGIEATLPKGSGTSDSTLKEVVQRDRRHSTLKRFEKKVHFVDKYSLHIEDDRQMAVLNCMLDGMSFVGISQHMGYSERKVYKIKDEIVRKMKENADNAEYAEIAG